MEKHCQGFNFYRQLVPALFHAYADYMSITLLACR